MANVFARARGPWWPKGLVVLGLICLLVAALATPALASGKQNKGKQWRLVYNEPFGKKVPDNAPWVWDRYGDNSWDHGPFDDDGQFFFNVGGQAFLDQLDTFRTYRKVVQFGHKGWLTAELSCRDKDNDGVCEAPPSLTRKKVKGAGNVGFIDEPRTDGGLLIRSTDPLPAEYRIEYELKTINFGGTRNGEWEYDGLTNGYKPEGCQTNHPWTTSQSSDYYLRPYCEWSDVRSANGFYNLAIADYPAAPYNNIMNHNTMKVRMDTYNTRGTSFRVCNPETGEFYRSSDNSFFMSFISLPQIGGGGSGFFYPPAMTPTDCGINFGPLPGVINTADQPAQIVPESMPKNYYTFAIERDKTGFTLEVSGHFKFGGERTFRYHRDFIQDGRPIWHYNQTPEEYDGQFDTLWTYEGPFGSFTSHTWPAGSAYPDYFIIGDPHSQYYEGTASVDNIRLYVPAGNP